MYDKFLIPIRRKSSTVPGRDLLQETASDRSRVIFSSSFRRLQQKAQVFSLEINAAVRSRLTHTLEVADYGRLIAQKISLELIRLNLLNKELQIPFINVVETTCLLHDIGNLPFGHFGETAIQEWFRQNWKAYFQEATKISESIPLNAWINDFIEFDGNPQGFRVITLLQQPAIDITGTGLNLTITQLYAFLKYTRVADGNRGEGLFKKPGYFNSEKHIVDDIQNQFDYKGRFPLTYIMEAADDMSYCLSDIEDGIEKKVLTTRDFFEKLKSEWAVLHEDKAFPFGLLDDIDEENWEETYFIFKTRLARNLIDFAADTYVGNHDEIITGKISQLFDKESEAHLILETFKRVARKILFRSEEAEKNELAGHAVIGGLMDKFSPLLKLSSEEFTLLVVSRNDPSVLNKKGLDIQLRLFNRLPKKYVEAYSYSLDHHHLGEADPSTIEWYFRSHLIVDFICGMTDLFALRLYRLLHGIEIR